MHIDHTTFRTNNIEATKDFFVQIFDLKVGERPKIIEKNIPGFWLYAGNDPLVHIIKSAPRFGNHNDYASEAIDHTAFYMTGYNLFRKKLDDLKIDYTSMELPEINERRIFLHTPTGILLETVFRNE